MDGQTIGLILLTVVGVLVYWYRNSAYKKATTEITCHLHYFYELAARFPECVPPGFVLDEAHLATITPAALAQFNQNLHLRIQQQGYNAGK